MTKISARHVAYKTLINHKIFTSPSYNDLVNIIESKQFIIIPYKKHKNVKSVDELINKLQIKTEIEHNDCFIYFNDIFRFVFINDELSVDDKTVLLRHELGHILDPDFKNPSISSSKIKKEEFANEFSHHINKPGFALRFFVFLKNFPVFLITLSIIILCILVAFLYYNYYLKEAEETSVNKYLHNRSATAENPDETYYVTSGGKKYHRSYCIIIKNRINLTLYTLNDAINAGYKPCMICNPEGP